MVFHQSYSCKLYILVMYGDKSCTKINYARFIGHNREAVYKERRSVKRGPLGGLDL